MEHETLPPDFAQALQLRLDQGRRDGAALCLLLFELEGFSALALAQGATATAQALERMDSALRSVCRTADCSYIYQADRLAVLLSATELPAGQRRGEQLLGALVQAGVATRIFGGLAEAGPGNWRDAQSLMQEADERLSAARHGGGNHVFSRCFLDLRVPYTP